MIGHNCDNIVTKTLTHKMDQLTFETIGGWSGACPKSGREGGRSWEVTNYIFLSYGICNKIFTAVHTDLNRFQILKQTQEFCVELNAIASQSY